MLAPDCAKYVVAAGDDVAVGGAVPVTGGDGDVGITGVAIFDVELGGAGAGVLGFEVGVVGDVGVDTAVPGWAVLAGVRVGDDEPAGDGGAACDVVGGVEGATDGRSMGEPLPLLLLPQAPSTTSAARAAAPRMT